MLVIIQCYIIQKMLRGRPRRGQEQEMEEEHREDEYREQNHNPLQQFVDLLVEVLQNKNQNSNPPTPQLTTFQDFKNVRPPEFKGTTEVVHF